MTALVIAEHDNASIKGATLNTVTAAAACGGDVHVLVAGHNAGGAAQAAAQASAARAAAQRVIRYFMVRLGVRRRDSDWRFWTISSAVQAPGAPARRHRASGGAIRHLD